ncbi:hypothetical protein CRENBAI_007662 [Crenichthys baileyi]|uniref:Uncharacterized protein n=1 Tax=Crenichthys baileyi TaxID=28760 RepID=A0AAV9S195_9TELE
MEEKGAREKNTGAAKVQSPGVGHSELQNEDRNSAILYELPGLQKEHADANIVLEAPQEVAPMLNEMGINVKEDRLEEIHQMVVQTTSVTRHRGKRRQPGMTEVELRVLLK